MDPFYAYHDKNGPRHPLLLPDTKSRLQKLDTTRDGRGVENCSAFHTLWLVTSITLLVVGGLAHKSKSTSSNPNSSDSPDSNNTPDNSESEAYLLAGGILTLLTSILAACFPVMMNNLYAGKTWSTHPASSASKATSPSPKSSASSWKVNINRLPGHHTPANSHATARSTASASASIPRKILPSRI